MPCFCSKFPGFHVPCVLCWQGCIFPEFHVPRTLCFQSTQLPVFQPNFPRLPSYQDSMFKGLYIPRVPCSQGSKLPLCYVSETSSQGPMFPPPTCHVFSGCHLSAPCFYGPMFICFSPIFPGTVCSKSIVFRAWCFVGSYVHRILFQLCLENPMFLESNVPLDDIF